MNRRLFLLQSRKNVAIIGGRRPVLDKTGLSGVWATCAERGCVKMQILRYQERQNERRERLEKLLESGVEIPLFDGILIDPQVSVAPGAVILPGTILRGSTQIGAGCEIGPNSVITNSTIGENSVINASYVTESTVGSDCRIGPFTQLRPDSHVGNGVKIGDFVELKNTTVGDKTSIAHLTYLGDSEVGSLCNFGCGVVTANYDGKKKYKTTVGDRAFIGCNTNLISPVHVGDGAYTAAGTTVYKDVPDGALAIGRARQENRAEWAKAHIAFKENEQLPEK